MRLVRLALVAALVTAVVPAPSGAQGTTMSPRAGAPVATHTAVGVRRLANAPLPAPTPAPFRQDTRQNRALMIVGGAALLTGAVIGGDAGVLISVGGAVVGLWGLFQYLQ